MFKNLVFKSALFGAVLIFTGCGGGGGGVVGNLIKDDDSNSGTTVSMADLDGNTTAQNQLLLARQLDLTADIYQEAIDEINANSSYTLSRKLKKSLDDKTELLNELTLLKAKYDQASNNIINAYGLSSYYSIYTNNVLSTQNNIIKNELDSSSDILTILKNLSKAEEHNLKYIEEYKSVLTDTSASYDNLIAESKDNFKTFISEVYDNGGTYEPEVLDTDTFNTIVITDLELFADTTGDNFNIINTFEDNNVTKIQASRIGNKPLYLSNETIKNNLFYISKQQELSNQLFSQFKSYSSVYSLGTPLTNIYSSELTHFNNGANLMMSEYGINSDYSNYSSASLSSLYNEVNSSTPTTSTLTETLKALIYLQERSIFDLTDSISKNTTHTDINELYEKMKMGSQNHLRYLVSKLYENGSSYYPQLLDTTTYTEIIGTMVGSDTSTNITIDKIYGENNITKVLVTKTNINSFSLNTNIEKESLLYISKQEEMMSDLFIILKSYNSSLNASDSIVTKLWEAESTHFTAAEDMLSFYNLSDEYSGYSNSGIQSFENMILSSVSSSSGASDILKKLMMIEERSIKYLNDHIANSGSSNDDLLNLYNSFLTASKYHIKLLAEVLFDPDGYDTTYTPSILSSEEYTTIVGTLGESVIEIIDTSKPNINFYTTYGDNNVTSLSITQLDVSQAPYSQNDNEPDKRDLAYIAQLEKITAEVFSNFVSIISDPLSTYTKDNDNISDLLVSMTTAEGTHYTTINTMLTIYGTNIDTNSALDTFKAERIALPTTITNESEYIQMLSSLALMLERSIYDLDLRLENGIALSEIKELFNRLLNGSRAHLKIIVQAIQNAQGSYSYQLLGENQMCGGTDYENSCIIGDGSTDENVDVYLYVAANGISDVAISEKPFGGELLTNSIAEESSLRYVDYLMNQLQLASTLVYAKLNTAANFTPLDQIIPAQSSHVSAMTEAISVFDVDTAIADTDKDSIDEFYTFVTTKNTNDTNNTKEDLNIINVIGLIEERKILDLEDHITNTVNQNSNIINIYRALQNAAKNHLLIIDKLVTEQTTLPYAPQLLEESVHSQFLPYTDETSFIKGTPASQ